MPTPSPSDPLSRALDEAVAGKRERLFDLLARNSHLPGPRANDALAEAFAVACRAKGPPVDRLLLAMVHFTADEAPGATPLEFLPACGVLALGTRAAVDAGVRDAFVAELHTCAEDLRFRVRESVVDALARVGGVSGDALVQAVAPWMDGYFHAAAVVRALGRETWLTSTHAAAPVVARLDEAFLLIRDAPRAAARYPGHKALVDALGKDVPAIAMRFGVPIFDMMVRWAAVRDPVLREGLGTTVRNKKLAGRFKTDLERLRKALETSQPPARNPDHDHGPSRNRGGTRNRNRYK